MGTVLDWSAGSIGPPEPCAICAVPTILRSPRDVACHKACAEAWADAHAVDADERSYEQVELPAAAGADADEL